MAHSLTLNATRHIALSSDDRRQHLFISGLPSTGVSTYVLALLRQDIQSGTPVILFDPYGDMATRVLETITDDQMANTAYIDVGNRDYPVGLNLFAVKTEEEKRDVVTMVVNLLYTLYDPHRTGIIGPRFEHAVRNAILTMMYDQTSTFIELVRCLTDASYVDKLLPKVSDPFVKNYWTKQIAQTSDFHKSEVLDYIVSKFSKFVTDKRMRNIVGQGTSTIDFLQLIEQKKLIIFDISSLRDDSEAMRIVYEILLLQLTRAFARRVKKNDIALYIDEANDFPAYRLGEILKSGRREGLSVTATSQRIAEIPQSLQRELLKAGTIISFRLSTDNASILAPEFHTRSISADQLCMLKKFHMYIKTLQEGNPVVYEEVSTEMERDTLEYKGHRDAGQLKAEFAKTYGQDIATVEKDIASRIA